MKRKTSPDLLDYLDKGIQFLDALRGTAEFFLLRPPSGPSPPHTAPGTGAGQGASRREAPRSPDPYLILGVDRQDSEEVIKGVFRIKAKAYHPDHGGKKEDFQRLKAAYDAIMKERKRRR